MIKSQAKDRIQLFKKLEKGSYPFGLTMHGICSKAAGSLINKKGFNANELQSKEFSDGSGLELYDFNARTYDQQIGRFIQVDPLSEEGDQESWSAYHFGYNNPVRYADPDGKLPIIPIVWGLYELGSAIYDGYQAYKTVNNKSASTGEKAAAVGGALLGAVLPGGGYGTAVKTTVKAIDKAKDAAKALPQLKGKSIPKVEKTLKKEGFEKVKDNGKNQTFKHNDGSEVRVHKYGNEKKTQHKSANNAHVHKQDPSGNQLNDRGIKSSDPNATHIGVKNPKDLPQVRNRSHGSGN